MRAHPRRRTRSKPVSRLRCREHLQHVRGFGCSVPGCKREPIEAAHVRLGVPLEDKGGTGMKPHDKWAIPLCGGPDGHHAQQHRVGEASFDELHHIDSLDIAAGLWRASPHRRKLEAA